MLISLSITNYALIDVLNVNFSSGFSIITGETGAGKSILLGGLSLVLGKRADLSQIKDKSKKCVIEAVFDIENYDLQSVFDTKDLDYEPQTIIRREILPSGKSRAFVNDTPVVLEQLNVLSSHLLDIHSQHQTLQLVDDDYQFKVIDALANNYKVLKNYAVGLLKYKALKSELKKLENTAIDAKKEQDYNVFLLNELEEAQLVDGELEQLETSYEQLNNVELINEALSYSQSVLNQEELGVIEKLKTIKRQLFNIKNFDVKYASLEARINSSIVELDDVLSELDVLEENLVSDPSELEKINTKLQLINNLMQKHNASSILELISLKENLKVKVDTTANLDNDISELKYKISETEVKLNTLCKKLHENRKAIVPKFKSNLEAILQQLGMPNAQFNIDFTIVNDFKHNGKDNLQFLFKANKGGNFTDIGKSASGGELSRIMLAVKSILSNYVKLPTIMFDEIDTGVSGEISNKMGDIMLQMSNQMQVFSITHLPQIASKGHHHYKVYKSDTVSGTTTQMRVLSKEERVKELAQMLGGKTITDSAIAHAKQLLN